MGWVEQKVKDYKATQGSLAALWDSMRDSVGRAIAEFNGLIVMPGVDHGDCTARATRCIRVRRPGKSIEIFLSPDDQTVRYIVQANEAPAPSGNGQEVCRYRLNNDRSGLEFYGSDGSGGMSADEVSERALEEFLFIPFPLHIRPTT